MLPVGKMNFQTKTVLVIKFLRGEDENGEAKVIGKKMLIDTIVKANMGGRTEVLKVLKNEEERVQTLEEVFDIKLIEEEQEGIRGRVLELGRVETVLKVEIDN